LRLLDFGLADATLRRRRPSAAMAGS